MFFGISRSLRTPNVSNAFLGQSAARARLQAECGVVGARVGRFLGSDSPLTMGVIWSLPIPIWFLTSQTKVVLTESSTFSTLSSCSFFSTVSGKTPDILQGVANDGASLRKWRNGRITIKKI